LSMWRKNYFRHSILMECQSNNITEIFAFEWHTEWELFNNRKSTGAKLVEDWCSPDPELANPSVDCHRSVSIKGQKARTMQENSPSLESTSNSSILSVRESTPHVWHIVSLPKPFSRFAIKVYQI
jgi:hypothetical protein